MERCQPLEIENLGTITFAEPPNINLACVADALNLLYTTIQMVKTSAWASCNTGYINHITWVYFRTLYTLSYHV